MAQDLFGEGRDSHETLLDTFLPHLVECHEAEPALILAVLYSDS